LFFAFRVQCGFRLAQILDRPNARNAPLIRDKACQRTSDGLVRAAGSRPSQQPGKGGNPPGQVGFEKLVVDDEMQADTAVTPEILEQTYPFSSLKGGANVLIFPSLESGNIAYKLLSRIGGAEAIGPILMGLSKPVHVLQRAPRSGTS
jgi:hypothetical protein